MAYVLRDKITNKITLMTVAPQDGFVFINDEDQELIDWKAQIAANIIAENAIGFQSKKDEDYAKILVKEFASHFKDDVNMPQSLKDAAQNFVDNVT